MIVGSKNRKIFHLEQKHEENTNQGTFGVF